MIPGSWKSLDRRKVRGPGKPETKGLSVGDCPDGRCAEIHLESFDLNASEPHLMFRYTATPRPGTFSGSLLYLPFRLGCRGAVRMNGYNFVVLVESLEPARFITAVAEEENLDKNEFRLLEQWCPGDVVDEE